MLMLVSNTYVYCVCSSRLVAAGAMTLLPLLRLCAEHLCGKHIYSGEV
jgi:hypothetical protein